MVHRLSTVAALLLVLEGTAPGAPAVATARLRGVGADDAALFVAQLYRQNVLVLAPAAKRIASLEVVEQPFTAAMKLLAAEAGLRLVTRGKLHVLAPPSPKPAVCWSGHRSGGPAVSLDFRSAQAGNLVALLSDVVRLPRPRVAAARLSVLARQVPARELLAAVIDLAGCEASTSPVPPHSQPTPDPCAAAAPAMQAVLLGCTPVADLVLVATGSRRGVGLGALRARRGSQAGTVVLVKRGDHVGSPARRVERIEATGVRLDGGLQLELPR